MDLKLISGDAKATVTAVAYAVGVPREAGVIEGPDLPEDPEVLARARSPTRSSAGSGPSRRKRWSTRWSPPGATWR